MATRSYRRRRIQWIATMWVLGLGVLSSIVWASTYAIMQEQKGIYAGHSYGDAAGVVRDAMTARYGRTFASRVRYADPPVINTHLNNALAGRGQVRVFHLIGPQGVKYCVSVWGSKTEQVVHNIIIGGKYVIVKGCKF